MWSRRDVLIGPACTAAVAALSGAARATTGTDGVTVLRARRGEASLFGTDGPAQPVWGFDGLVPGPLIRVRRGAEVRVRLVNELELPMTIHWHGVRLASAMDSTADQAQTPAGPGMSFDYRFAPPDAGTFWYHAGWLPDQSQRPLLRERGLYGVLIVDEATPPPVDRDHIVVFSDWPFDHDGKLSDQAPRYLVNGGPHADLTTRTNERLRLRFVNASATEVMSARIDGHRVFVMALDGEPAEPFVARDSRVVLGPGNRADVFVDAVQAPGSTAPILFETGGTTTALARLVYESTAPVRAAPLDVPAPLPANPLPERMSFTRALRANLILGDSAPAHSSNAGRHGMPVFTAERGRTVMVSLDNRSPFEHAVHLHGHHVRLLDRLDDGWKPYWLDTILVPAQRTARIAFVADNPGRWLIEDHALPQGAVTANWFQVG